MPAYITGIGAKVPENVVTNEEIAPKLGLSPEQIFKSSGIRRRRWASPNDKTSDLAIEAAQLAMADAGVPGEEIEYLVFGTMTPDRFIPGTAASVQSKLQLREIPCLDIRAACSNALYGLQLAKALIDSGQAKVVLLCFAEIQSTMLELSENAGTISMLFGDGASGLIVSGTPGKNSLEIIDVYTAANGNYIDDLGIRGPGTEFGNTVSDASRKDFFPRMNGQSVILNASRKIVAACNLLLQRNSLAVTDIKWIVPHQANYNLLVQIGRALRFPLEHIVSVLEDYGNTSSASMGLALQSLAGSGSLRQGDYVLLPAFAAGFNWGAALCKVASHDRTQNE